jgi:tripartite-type tricarboxylate transporter receptor subunit TctC
METKQTYGIEELAKAGPRRSYLFRAIKEKRLIAQKAGRRTFVTHENWQAFLRSFPVVGEEGNVVPGFESVDFYVISAPKGTPPEIVDLLNKAIDEALKDPKLVARLAEVGGKVVEFAGVSVD